MTTRKFNYTGRVKLRRDNLDIGLHVIEDGRYAFDVNARLEDYGFPPEAMVVAEAYEMSRFERFELGQLGDLAFPVKRELSLFTEGEAVKFRLKVIGTGDHKGRLLGEADQVIPESSAAPGGSRMTILRTEGVDLGDRVWELNLDDEPLLRMNNKLGDWRSLATSAEFAFMVYPMILEHILEYVTIELRATPDSDLSAWEQVWLRFASRQPGVPDFPASAGDDDSRIKDWIDAAIHGFSRKNRLLGRAISFCSGGQE